MKKIFILFLILFTKNMFFCSTKSPNIIASKSPLKSPLQNFAPPPSPLQQPTSYRTPGCPTVNQETIPATPPPLKLPSPTLPPKDRMVSTGIQCENPNLQTLEGILRFLILMFNPDTPFAFMKIQSSHINDMVKLQLLYYRHKEFSENGYSYIDGQNREIVKSNPNKTSIFAKANNQNIPFPENFDDEVLKILQNSRLQIPANIKPTFFDIITAREQGLILREKNGEIRYIP